MQSPRSVDRLDFLLVLQAILKCRTITRAADELGCTQSALSHALVGLRKRFRDPLFVRAKGEMHPTPLVMRFADPLERSLAIIRDEILGSAAFDADTSERAFKLRVNEIGAYLLVPRVIKLLRQRAPHASVTTVEIPRADIGEALEDGKADLAVGHYPELTANIFQQGLFVRGYAAIVRADHPKIGYNVVADEFFDLSFVRCTATVAMNRWLGEQFRKRGRTPKIALETPYVIALAGLVAATDCLTLVPQELVPTLANLAPVRAVELPFKLPTPAIKQHWHRRYKDDDANRFIRQVVFDALHE
jgi:DNA-binding transcriptional LysR family regulator